MTKYILRAAFLLVLSFIIIDGCTRVRAAPLPFAKPETFLGTWEMLYYVTNDPEHAPEIGIVTIYPDGTGKIVYTMPRDQVSTLIWKRVDRHEIWISEKQTKGVGGDYQTKYTYNWFVQFKKNQPNRTRLDGISTWSHRSVIFQRLPKK